MPPALLFRFSWDLSYHEPVSSASPWCFPVNACVLCHTHSIPYMLIYMCVPLLEIREQSRWISRKQIYFSIVYESFLLNFDLHVFDYNWDWTFFSHLLSSHCIFFCFHTSSEPFLNFLFVCSPIFLLLISKIPHDQGYSCFLYVLWVFVRFSLASQFSFTVW